jgi:hypothetical protein
MLQMSWASDLSRRAAAVLVALLLALRLVGSAGYMPAFEHGALTIIVCPDAELNAPLAIPGAHHHHGQTSHKQNVCPYADASALGFITNDFPPLIAPLAIALVLLLGRPFLFIERHRAQDRPPQRGPPLPA